MTPTALLRRLTTALLATLALLAAGAAGAEVVTLAWDANPPAEQVTGYRVHYGAVSRTDPAFTGYTAEVDAGNRLQLTVELPDPTRAWYFAVVAYNGLGLRSDFSDEVARLPAPPAPPPAPTPDPTDPVVTPGPVDGSGSDTPPPVVAGDPTAPAPGTTPGVPAPSDPTAPGPQPVAEPTLTVPPAVREPVSGAAVAALSPELSVYNPIWAGNTRLVYEFQVSANRGMAQPVAAVQNLAEGIGVTTWQVPVPLKDRTRHYWRARAWAGTTAGPWTPVCTFNVDSRVAASVARLEATQYVIANQPAIVEVQEEGSAARGLVVDVPEGSLPYDYVLTVGVVDNPPQPLGESMPSAFSLGPHGVPFGSPVTVYFPYTAADLKRAGVTDPADLRVVTYDTEALVWRGVTVDAIDRTGGRLVCRLEHFSLYGLARTADVQETVAPAPVAVTPPAPTPAPATPSLGGEGGGGGGGGGCFLSTLRW